MACKTLDVDIISLDMSQRLPFFPKHGTVGAAIERGITFEITYGTCLRNKDARKFFLHNATNLVRVTRGKNLIISSAALKAMDIRNPYDVINLYVS